MSGSRGPLPKPSALNDLNGNPGKRSTNKFEPQPPKVASVPPPQWLNEVAANYWNRIVPMLANVGLLTEVDLPLLERYCDHLSDYKAICDFLSAQKKTSYLVYKRDKLGNRLTEKNEKGGQTPIVEAVMPLPQVAQKIRLSEHLLKIEMHFGMSPASRTRIMVDPGAGQQLGNPAAGNFGGANGDAFDSDEMDDGSGRLPN